MTYGTRLTLEHHFSELQKRNRRYQITELVFKKNWFLLVKKEKKRGAIFLPARRTAGSDIYLILL
jgi:hypothetical protein